MYDNISLFVSFFDIPVSLSESEGLVNRLGINHVVVVEDEIVQDGRDFFESVVLPKPAGAEMRVSL